MCTDNFLLITVHTICQTCQEQNVQEPIPNVAVHYSAKDLLSNALQELDVPKLSFTSGWIYIIYIDFLPDSPTITFYLDNLLHVTQV